ncbi:MAG TPA: DUF2059 domain-containing protein [Bryobacteraceae bacterium]|nr:DUF2059 domain-containing protein [Bryobacteraceae bacterium]
MKSLLFLLYVGLLALVWPALVYADEASKAAKIEEMLALTHADRIVGQMTAQMQPMIAAQIQKMDLPNDARPAVEEMQKKMIEWMSSKLSWEKMKPIYVKIYAETLTEEEIASAVEYYKTPAGQAILNKMPILIQKSMSVMQEMMGDMIPELTKISEDLAKKYKKQ